MVSHVGNEAADFIPKSVDSDATFQDFLHNFMPEKELSDVRAAIQNQYNCQKSPYNGDYRLCVSTLIRDSSFTCNTRQLYDAYTKIGKKVYMMQYNFPGPTFAPAVHATDLLPTFINDNISIADITSLLKYLKVKLPARVTIAPVLKKLHGTYQKYLSSYAVFGDPNMNLTKGFPSWPFATDNGKEIQGTLEVEFGDFGNKFFAVGSDKINTQQACDFWNKVAVDISTITKGTKGSIVPFLVQRPEL